MHRLVVATFASLFVSHAADAATFFVNDTGDSPDTNPGDGVCTTSGGVCTLRAALAEANATPAADTIQFAIPGAPPFVIAPGSALPAITAPLAILGPALLGDTAQVVLDGVGGGSVDALVVDLGASTGCAISGLGITRFGNGIELDSGACTIRSNVIDDDNNGIIVLSSASGTVIGGPSSGDGNIIVSSVAAGVEVAGAAAGVTIQGNFIGVGSSGTVAQGNAFGILVSSGNGHVIRQNTISNNTIEGILVASASAQITTNNIGTDASGFDAAGNSVGIRLDTAVTTSVASNTISANVAGVVVENNSAGVSITSNLIGTRSNGQGNVGLQNQVGIVVQSGATNTGIGGNTIVNSSQFGIDVGSAGTGTTIVANVIGRDTSFSPAGNAVGIRLMSTSVVGVGAAGEGNTIVFNTQQGILVPAGADRFTQNSIHDNGALGIDIGNAGVSPNGSTAQDFPVIAAASNYNGTTYVRGSVQGPANSSVAVEVFANAACDPSGNGEGDVLLAAAPVAINAAGVGTFLIPAAPVSLGTPITTTATSTVTSEFSACVVNASCGSFVVSPDNPPGGVVGTLYSQAFDVGGVTNGYTFTTTNGAPPPGLTMAADGVLSGTPTTAGSYSFRVVATDQDGCGGIVDLTIHICPAIAIDPTSIPDGTTQTDYDLTFVASGGSAPYSYAFTSGQPIVGLTLDANTGAYTGTPVGFHSFVFTLTATDANSCSASRAYTVNISSCDLSIRPTDLPPPVTNTPFDVTLTTLGAVAPVTYAVSAGALPAGLALADADIAGTPTTLGPSSFTIQATAADGCVGSRAYQVTTTCGALAITPSTLDMAMDGASYSVQLSASGGSAPYTFTAENLPPGLTLSTTGVISGTPQGGLEQQVAITVTDAMGCTSTMVYSFTVDPSTDGGCCDTSRAPRGTWLLALLVIAHLRRRR